MTTDDRTRAIAWFEKQSKCLAMPGAAKMFGLAAEALNALDVENEPLTMEQLRNMDGKPVYVVPINQSEWICWENDSNAAYGLVRKSWVRVWREETADMQHTDFDFDDYRKTWLAYRRPSRKDDEA